MAMDAGHDSPAVDRSTMYPKPTGWEYMTDDERYLALRSEPTPDSEDLRSALAQAKRDVMRDRGEERDAIAEARKIAVLADAPQFTLSLEAPPTLSLSQNS